MSSDHVAMRPQPIGIFPLPVGHLLLPLPPKHEQETASSALQKLLEGDLPVDSLPSGWRFYTLAAEGNHDRAVQALATDDSPTAAYNRFSLVPTRQHYAALLDRLPAGSQLAELAQVVAYAAGLVDSPPSAAGFDGELRAWVLSAQAAAALFEKQTERAKQYLQQAVDAARSTSPLLAAQLLGQLVDLSRHESTRSADCVRWLNEAVALAGQTPQFRLRAELWFTLGTIYHEQANGRRDLLLQAVQAYQTALRCGLSRRCCSDLYAQIQNNIGLAYLSMPSGEDGSPLRMAVAVQSFREALEVYDRRQHPELWASTQMNLANAYQYLPSSHPEENLIRAVEAYDEVLSVRQRAADPVGYGLVIMNQANALAHLGMFSPALQKLEEARKLFHWHEQHDAAREAMNLAAQIHERLEVAQSTGRSR